MLLSSLSVRFESISLLLSTDSVVDGIILLPEGGGVVKAVSFDRRGYKGEGIRSRLSTSFSSGWKYRLSMYMSFWRSSLFSSN